MNNYLSTFFLGLLLTAPDSSRAVVTEEAETQRGDQGLRGAPETRKLPGNPFEGGEQEPPQERELSGNVIISRKTPGRLKAEGKGPAEIAEIRSRGNSEIKKNKVVFESLGDGDFQVVEVGKGKEAAFIKGIMNNPNVADLFDFIEPDYIENPTTTSSNDPDLVSQWHHVNIQSREAWDLETGSAAITVGICDTGIDVDHPDLQGNMLEGYHAPSQTWGGDISNVHPHGTNCAGCAASIGNNGVGIAGVGWHFKHRPGRVTDSSTGSASSSALADCARKMCEKPDVKVVSVSYSGVEGSARRSAATYCKSQGALMVNAAGNDDRDLSQYGNADADDLIVVAATDSSDAKTSWSAYGGFVDVWAPGASVYTTNVGGGYTSVSGTSFSCPLTAGLIALIWSKNPELTPDQVEAVLKESTDDLGLTSAHNTPYGRINSYKAVQAAGSGTPFPTPGPTIPPPSKAPTPKPTGAPVDPIDCSTYNSAKTCNRVNGCKWRGSSKSCEPN